MAWNNSKRKKKQQQKKIIRSVITFAIILILGLISWLTEPWQYLDSNDGKTEVGSKQEANINDLQVHYIDMGQADAILIRVPTENGTENMLVDAGTSSGYSDKVLIDYLDALDIETLTYMMITHPHLDHGGAAKEVIEAYNIENIILPECDATQVFWLDMFEAMEEKNLSYIPSEPGDTYRMGDASFTILGPMDTTNVKDKNDYSIVIRLDYGETSFVFTGDATVEVEKQMLKAHPASAFQCDVLKVGHHGSTTSTSKEFLAACNPSLAVIPCGEGNSYGHPEDVILQRLKDANVQVLRTDIEGTIIIYSDKNEVYRLDSD